ncbi:MAG: CDP-alcohol phosphatidyltransferase family protein, partial [Candidatus Moranbacteria bacterium]|nr:CDP-alcohol phosphatidyltransferase family protein [Candidatus Moranbacteria bacterium]
MKEIIKSQKKNFLKTTKILRFFSVRNARFLNELNITPNQVTFFRFFVLGIFGAYFFYLGGYLFNIIGLMLLFLNFYFDLVDGDLARNYDKKTKLGGFLEELLDPILL